MSPPMGRSVGTFGLMGVGYALYGRAYGSAAGFGLVSGVAFVSIKSLPSKERRSASQGLTRSASAPGALWSLPQLQAVRSLDPIELSEPPVWVPYEGEPRPPEPSIVQATEPVEPPRPSTFLGWWNEMRAMVSRTKGVKGKIVYLRNRKIHWEERFGRFLEIGKIEGALERTAMSGGEWTVMTRRPAAAEELVIDWAREGVASIKTILVGSPRNLLFSKGVLKRIEYRVLDGLFHHEPKLIDALQKGGELRYIFYPDNAEEIAKCRACSPSSEEERPDELHLVFSR